MFAEKSLSRIILLHVIAILLVIFNVSDIRIAGIASVIPLFDLMAVFYFAVFKNIFGIWFVFLLGIWNDALNGNPLGTTALCYILLIKLFSFLNNRMIIRENFTQIWRQFIGFCFLFLLIKWLILSIFDNGFLNLATPLAQLILSSLVYVLMHKFFDYLSEKLLSN